MPENSEIMAVGTIINIKKQPMGIALNRVQRREFLGNLKRLNLSTLFFLANDGQTASGRRLDAFIPETVARQFSVEEKVRVMLKPSENGPDGRGFLVTEKLNLSEH